MKKLQFIFAAVALLVLSLGMTGCDPNDPNNPDNPATSEIVSTFEIYNEIFDNLVVEAIYKNDTRMYFVLLNADSCCVTSYYFYYGSSNFVRYAYGSNLVIPETLTHKGVTYNVIGAGGLDYGGAGDKVTSIWINTNMEKLHGGPTQFPLLTSINVTTDNPYCAAIDGVLFNKEKTELIEYPSCKVGNEYTVPNGVTNIGDEAFAGCKSLVSVVLPSSVTNMHEFVFRDCHALSTLTCLATTPPNLYYHEDSYSTFEDSKITTVKVPAGSVSAYRSAAGWKDLTIVAL